MYFTVPKDFNTKDPTLFRLWQQFIDPSNVDFRNQRLKLIPLILDVRIIF